MTNQTKTTSELWDIAHNCLCGKKWAKAVQALEALMQRGHFSDALADATAYGAPDYMVQYLQDRIDACNRR